MTGSSPGRPGPAGVGDSRRGTRAAARPSETRAGDPGGKPRRVAAVGSVSRLHRRRRFLAAALLGVAVLAGLGVGVRELLYGSGLADVEGVTVTGAVSVPVSEVLAAAAVIPGGPLAAVDTAEIETRVAQLPGVADAAVGRDWPHTVTVMIVERVPVATASTPQGPYLVDGTGLAFLPASETAGLPRLTFGSVGPEDPRTRAALTVLAALPGDIRDQVLTVGVTAVTDGVAGTVILGLTDDRQVRWGSPDRAMDKASVLAPLLTRPGRVYDIASPELPTVRS
ncbi:MAG: cell division protein FtsQ/DivIB [Pseudonocardia sp.]